MSHVDWGSEPLLFLIPQSDWQAAISKAISLFAISSLLRLAMPEVASKEIGSVVAPILEEESQRKCPIEQLTSLALEDSDVDILLEAGGRAHPF